MAYRCTKRCDFTLDLECATLPLTAWYKHDRHPLTLTCFDDFDPSQHYCDLCEYERDPNDWFYYCAECDNSLHSRCALGDLPFLKIGSNLDKHSAVRFAMDKPYNVKNLNVTLASIGTALIIYADPPTPVNHRFNDIPS
ncbi:hypothetical protein Goari_019970 [Gossypium aridum]|uniref:DC1 domain-containing protein n=1 Tax=Gossypium aridum TaxID=34290 RepID=A0A7J8WVQ2_GOSAI|nr:hypothetical protein [Gossypium aridum]